MSAIRGTLGINTAKQFEKISGEIDAETAHKRAAFAPLEKATPFQTKIATLLERILLTGVPIKNVKELSKQTGKQDVDKKRLKDDDDILPDDSKRSKPGRQFGRMALGYGVSSAIGAMQAEGPTMAGVGIANSLGSGLMMTGNVPAMVTGGIIQLIAGITKMNYEMKDRLLRAFQPLSGLRDIDAKMLAGQFLPMQQNVVQYGYHVSDWANRQTTIEKARGEWVNEAEATRTLGFERIGLMTEELVTALYGLQRSATDQRTFEQMVVEGSRVTGGSPQLLQETLSMLIGIGQDQLKVLGRVNQGINERVVGNLVRLGGIMSNPQVAMQAYTRLHKGLTSASTPQVEALQFEALRRIKPGASLAELMRIREEGLRGEHGAAYATGMMKFVKQISGGDIGQQQIMLASMTGLSQNMAYEFIKLWNKNQQEGLDYLKRELEGEAINYGEQLQKARAGISQKQIEDARENIAEILKIMPKTFSIPYPKKEFRDLTGEEQERILQKEIEKEYNARKSSGGLSRAQLEDPEHAKKMMRNEVRGMLHDGYYQRSKGFVGAYSEELSDKEKKEWEQTEEGKKALKEHYDEQIKYIKEQAQNTREMLQAMTDLANDLSFLKLFNGQDAMPVKFVP